MKRSELIDFIKDELVEINNCRRLSNEKDEKYYLRKAAGMLDMIEGFGMIPPLNEEIYHHMDNEDRQVVNLAKSLYTWENEE